MPLAKVVIREVQRDRSFKVFNLFAERIREPGKAARWGKLTQATHRGSFKEEFGTDVECYVLDDSQKTAVISQSGMGKALGLSHRGNAFPRFLASSAMSQVVSAELRDKLTQPIKFQWGSGGSQQPPTTVNGFDATLLVDICYAILVAEPQLTGQQKHVADQARIILTASAKSGIKGLIYALAGYSPSTQQVIAAFKMYVMEEARKYEKEFHPDLYVQWQRLYQLSLPANGKPWQFKHLTVRHIYFPLAKSNGRIFQLLKILKSNDGDRQKKLFQFLSELGARALRIHMGRVLEMAESSPNSFAYEKRIAERFGGQQELDLVLPPAG